MKFTIFDHVTCTEYFKCTDYNALPQIWTECAPSTPRTTPHPAPTSVRVRSIATGRPSVVRLTVVLIVCILRQRTRVSIIIDKKLFLTLARILLHFVMLLNSLKHKLIKYCFTIDSNLIETMRIITNSTEFDAVVYGSWLYGCWEYPTM